MLLAQTSSCVALKLSMVNGALVTEEHNYGTTLALKSGQHPLWVDSKLLLKQQVIVLLNSVINSFFPF